MYFGCYRIIWGLGLSWIAYYCAIYRNMTSGHVFRTGECPTVDSMADFSIDQFLGEWYVIQKFRSASDCVRENFTKIEDRYCVSRISNLLGSPVISTVNGVIEFPKNGSQSEMSINYPLSDTGIINIKHYAVLATDYDSYALVWNCQPMIVGHRQSAQIMSRRPTLDRKVIAELRELLANYDINQHYLTIVRQTNCPNIVDNTTLDKPVIVLDDDVNCNKDKPVNSRPVNNNHRSGISLRIGPFHFSAILPFFK
ncbi:apolipoprotein D-like [Oppia nitens]|uniref:apolipoprotein D-like n=1 Tax=Oppia nitens TaxID=1686743 RepID=UPI0023DCB422|nr:apolipoprotein D-like [Oppia nitens]